jgi:hypothetical protein
LAQAQAIIWTKVDGQQQYRALSRRLREAGRGDLQRKLTRAIRREGQPALNAVRQAWLSIDVESLPPNDRGGHGRPDTSTGLRQRVARATRMSVRQNGIAISVSGTRVDARYPTLAMYLNGFPRKRPWRHPVFGNRLVWVAQRGREVFYPTLIEYAPRWRKGVVAAIEDTIREIERGV